jgi:hypothetical protein
VNVIDTRWNVLGGASLRDVISMLSSLGVVLLASERVFKQFMPRVCTVYICSYFYEVRKEVMIFHTRTLTKDLTELTVVEQGT